MGNEVFEDVLNELSPMGAILATAVIKKGLEKIQATPDTVTQEEMARVIQTHILLVIDGLMPERQADRAKVNLKRKYELLDKIKQPASI